MDSGTKVAVYPYNTLDTAYGKALATGTIIKAGSYSATVKLDKDPGLQRASLGRVFITQPVYTMKPINIRAVKKEKALPGGYTETEITNIQDAIKDMPLIKFDDEADLLIIKGKQQDSIIVASNGYLFDKIDNIPANTARFKERLQQYAQYKFLKGLPEVRDPDIKMEVRLVPVINGKADTAMMDTKLMNGTYEYHIGDTMFIWVKNSGRSPFYINILDLQPDGIINAVFPNTKPGINIQPGDLMVRGESEHLFSNYFITIGPPVGQEYFKIFASKTMINLEDIATTRGFTTRGNLTFLEQLVKKSYDITRGGVVTENISSANGTMYNLLFRIAPKQ